jgi:lysophospholipase L1-like esterase
MTMHRSKVRETARRGGRNLGPGTVRVRHVGRPGPPVRCGTARQSALGGTGMRFATAAVTAGLVVLLTGCGSSERGGHTAAQPSVTDPSQRAVTVVALGDSDATGAGDPSGRGWVGRYGGLLQTRLDSPVRVDNQAVEGKTSQQLLEEVTNDAGLQRTLADADVILIGIGGADLNAGDNALSEGRCQGRNCYTAILRRFDSNISAIAGEVRRLAPSALVRAISLPDVFPGAGAVIPAFITADISLYEVKAQRTSVCRAMSANGGRCADAVRAFNGPSGKADAYRPGLVTRDPCCYPSGKGQQWIARLLIDTGIPGPSGAP